jgi:hypothetical protein
MRDHIINLVLRSTQLEVEIKTLQTDLNAAQGIWKLPNHWQCMLDLEEPGAFQTSIPWM